MADFISTKLVDQLKLKREILAKPMTLQLAVHGSRSKVNASVAVKLKYQSIDSERRLDVANLDDYDVILGTPFIFQHQILIGMNPTRVVVGSDSPLEMRGAEISMIRSAAADLFEQDLSKIREMLKKEAADLCPDPAEADLPPFRAVNHTIPLKDESKVYRWRPSKCPEPLKEIWRAKKETYMKSGRWRMAAGSNASPMLILPKPMKADRIQRIRTVIDKREQNENTVKMASPLPDIQEILRNVSRHPYRTLVDGKDFYEQIRVVPEHVSRTLFNTPDGTMESLVLQQGDCNGPATCQALMNHVFAPHIGIFVHVYLDDIIIFSDSVEDHIKHVRMIFDILRREKLYLSADKMQFFAEKLQILGHIIDQHGILMDPHKVESVVNWKTPTNQDLLASFIGTVGYLAEDCHGIRIPMGMLTELTGVKSAWKWGPTEQRAFDEVRETVHKWRNHHRVSIDYTPGALPINLVTDASCTGASGYVSQGENLENAKVIAFWSGKFNSAQQNYPVHEQELLDIVESLKRFRGLLHGAKFRILTDHRSLEHLMKQKNLSPRQHRWLDILNEFDFNIKYIPGETNELADALSRLYSDEPLGGQRAASEYVSDDSIEINKHEGAAPEGAESSLTTPVYTGAAAVMEGALRRSSRLAEKAERPPVAEQPQVAPKRKQRAQKTKTIDPHVSEAKQPAVLEPKEAIKRPGRSETHEAVQINDLPGVLTAGDIGIPLPGSLKHRYHEDKFFRNILLSPSEYKDFKAKEGLVFKARDGLEVLCIPDIKIQQRSVREIIIKHAHSLLAHLGYRKTLDFLRQEVWWKTMVEDVEAYCKTCITCSTTKPNNQKPMGLLQTLPVPRHPWQYIGIDFVGPLPESTTRHGAFDMICVIIDHLTSMVHLVPTRQTYGAKHIAEVIFDSVYKLHGLPEKIISDRDSLFTSTFWKRLNELIGVELKLSTAYHPQTDGITDR